MTITVRREGSDIFIGDGEQDAVRMNINIAHEIAVNILVETVVWLKEQREAKNNEESASAKP